MLTKRSIRALILACAFLIGYSAPALADVVKFPAVEAVDAGPISPTGYGTSPVLVDPPAGAPEVPDPVASPGGFVDGVKALGKKGWPLAIVVGLLGVATALRKRVSWFSEPGTKRAAVTSGAIAVAAAVAARLADAPGVAWVDVFVVLASAIAYALHSTTKPPAPQP